MRFFRAVLVGTMLVLVFAAFEGTTVAAASADTFTGAWTATDTDGSTLTVQISAPNPSGLVE
jgi:hypothetical protein